MSLSKATIRTIETDVSVTRALREGFWPHRTRLVLTGSLAAVAAVVEIGIIGLIAAMTGEVLGDSTSVPVLSSLSQSWLAVLTALAVAIKVLLDLLYARVAAGAMRHYESSIRSEIAHLQARTRWEVVEDSEPGALHSLMWTSTNQAKTAFNQLLNLLTSTTSLALMLVATVFSAGWLSLVGVVGVVLFAVVFRPLSVRSKQAGSRLKSTMLAFGASLNEDLRMTREVRVLGAQDVVADRLAASADEVAEAGSRQMYLAMLLTSAYSNAIYAVALLGFVAIAWSGTTNPAPLAALVLLLYRSLVYGRGVQSASQALASTAPFVADVNQWVALLRENVETRVGSGSIATFEDLTLSNVDLEYANGVLGLHDVTLRIGAGEAIAVVGRSGSGKSSFVSIVLALREATAGTVSVNGVALAELDKADWRTHVALVPQESVLFDATVVENVRCWRPGLTDDEVIEALRRAHVLDEVLAMPDGLDTGVGEGGRRLSGGQRQRICLARALVTRPALLVLDEPTSALDGESERAVKQSLQELKGEVTLVVVAHRMTTIEFCDRILVFEDGSLRHDGSPEEVFYASEFFARTIELAASSGIGSDDDDPGLGR